MRSTGCTSELHNSFLERRAEVWTGWNGLPGLQPNMRKVDLLSQQVVLSFLPFSEMHGGILQTILRRFRLAFK
jgi:hypothetical protein